MHPTSSCPSSFSALMVLILSVCLSLSLSLSVYLSLSLLFHFCSFYTNFHCVLLFALLSLHSRVCFVSLLSLLSLDALSFALILSPLYVLSLLFGLRSPCCISRVPFPLSSGPWSQDECMSSLHRPSGQL